ncbi:MAG: hypothetical protein A2869_03515 [Candidatus Levybacteria bacterium RIFCSPHIGHO2_01_FULL_40_58]|nr:MAG: hypothetical protein A2869_03515 [Candidatus Levybacteria bacterium RIFCSPHIGHO2_01_FULL_40_58]OGH30918.1 MAG: hypothetical protein A3E43_04235 [Candidatus Levybacteria bacterium RIFCSPHIGHO2_12_FULL_40_31]OGH40929.1 MAG: hypothetical protein A2894_01450 [Candidatus Levybacteria bacterium RIFCSPLOWO2_01_FULL_40_64]
MRLFKNIIKTSLILVFFSVLFLLFPKGSFAQISQEYYDQLLAEGWTVVGTNPDGSVVLDNPNIECTNGTSTIYPPGSSPGDNSAGYACDCAGDGYIWCCDVAGNCGNTGNLCTDRSDPTSTPTPTVKPTATRIPTPKPTTPTPTPTKKPTPTPIPTKIPNACGVTCTRDADCTGSQYSSSNQCAVCDLTTNTCKPPPTPTPTSTPTPTPIPFNPAACKCDGIEYSDLFSGQQTTITSFGKVEGDDIGKAQIVDQRFFLAEGAETTATIIGRSDLIPSSIVENTGSKVRYVSKWTFTMPQLKQSATYRIWSQINCQPKLQAFAPPQQPKKGVLQAVAEAPKSFIDRMIDFLNRLFGVETQKPQETAEIDSSDLAPSPTGKRSLQIGTIYPVEVYQKTCSFIKFRFENFGQ